MSRRRPSFDLDTANRGEVFHVLASLTREGRQRFMAEVVGMLPPRASQTVFIGSDFNWCSPMEQMFDLLSLHREWGLDMDAAARLLTTYARRNSCTSSAA